MQSKRNIAARAGHWSAKHRKTAILGWIAFVILAFMVGGNTGTHTLSKAESGVGDSGKAAVIVDRAYPKKVHEAVMVQSAGHTAYDPAFRATVHDQLTRLHAIGGVREIDSPYSKAGGGKISPDGHTALIGFEIPGEATAVPTKRAVDGTLAATAAVSRAHPGMRVEQFGEASSEKAFDKIVQGDLQKAETTSLPITLLILLITFGALVAAGIPLILAITAVLATFGLIGPLSQLAAVDSSIQNVVLLIGLAVGVDYSLFYLRRVREERAAGKSNDAAIDAAAATSGRAVLVSGVTVMAAMAGMYLAGAATFTSFATGTIVVVAVAMLGSLTVLPALLSVLGDRADKGRIPGLQRLKNRMGRIGLWSRFVDRVVGHPWLSATISGGLLVALAIPALQLHTGQPGTDSLPKDLPVVQTFERLRAAFPSETSSMDVVLKAKDVTAPAARQAITQFEHQMAARPELFPAPDTTVEVSPDHSVATISFAVAGNGEDAKSDEALDVLRADIVPPTLASVAGAQAYVTGEKAASRDFNDTLHSNLIYVFGFVLTAAFLLLLFTFRSIVVPIKAIVLNLLSVAAAYGAMVLVFQHGWFKSLLGFSATGPIVAWLPLFLFVVLFGLSMDYHVFILTRVREGFDRGMTTKDAVAAATKSTAGVVTSAAIVMVCVFSVFATLSLMDFKQLGVGLAVAVFIDATLIRGVLLPATMTILGDRNWWLPRSLGWLPHVAPDMEVMPAKA